MGLHNKVLLRMNRNIPVQVELNMPSKHGPDFHPPGPQSVETLESEISPS